MTSGDALVDVAGLRVGHHERLDGSWATGTTVVLTPDGATAAVDVRGGAPGTRETDALDPSRLVQQAHGVVLTGGSAYGLAAADGVMRWLEERGHGFAVGAEPGQVVPIVPAAVLMDLPMGEWGNRPDAEFGRLACEAAGPDARQGTVGAGTGSVAGFLKGGLGTASAPVPNGTIGALVAVNSAGSVIDPSTGLPFSNQHDLPVPDPTEVAAGRERAAERPSRRGPTASPLNTTIGVIATDLRLSSTECQRIAVAAQDGLARAVRPAHAMIDGETLFVLATGAAGDPDRGSGWPRYLDELCSAAADVVERAVVRGVLHARTAAGVMSYTDLYPSVLE